MPTTFVGIDPGITGAFVVLQPGCPVVVYDMPTLQTKVTKTIPKAKRKEGEKASKLVNRNVFDENRIASIVREICVNAAARNSDVYAVLEQVNAMPARGPGGVPRPVGATSMFNFGFGYGLLCMALTSARIKHTRVAPARWKKAILTDVSKGDGAVAAFAERLYPLAAPLLRGPRGGIEIGRVDALLLAHYGAAQERAAGLIT